MDLMKQALKRRSMNCIWLGIDDASTEGTYTYSSDRTLVDPGVKSVFHQANRCDQPGLKEYGSGGGSRDCDYIYFCTNGITYTYVSDNGGFDAIACEV